MDKVSYSTLQKKYPGKIVAISEKNGKVVATAKTTREIEEQLKQKDVDPGKLLFIGPIERYKQISVY